MSTREVRLLRCSDAHFGCTYSSGVAAAVGPPAPAAGLHFKSFWIYLFQLIHLFTLFTQLIQKKGGFRALFHS